jgi:Ca2+-binding RTX toxin-like protein
MIGDNISNTMRVIDVADQRIWGEGHEYERRWPCGLYAGDAGTDIINEGNGSDQILVSNGNDNIFGEHWANEIIGGEGHETFFGGMEATQ